MLRRKRLPPELAAAEDRFAVAVGIVEEAKAAVVDALPTARTPGRPIADALADFEEKLRAAREAMAAWHAPQIDAEWEACGRGLDGAMAATERLRTEAPELGFDGLSFAIQDLIAPLEAFGRTAERFRALRR